MSETIGKHQHLVGALGDAVAAYHRGTFEHSMRVGAHACRIGEAVALDASSLEALGWAGALHDLGKLAIPQTILSKPGSLTPAEWEQVKAHPAVGGQLILVISPGLGPVAAAVRAHHERWDGTGYPDGLRGDEIPILGRIIAFADVYDALTHDRHYRNYRFTSNQAVEMIVGRREAQFDPNLVKAFLSTLDDRSGRGESRERPESRSAVGRL